MVGIFNSMVLSKHIELESTKSKVYFIQIKKKRKEKNQDYKGQKIKYYYKINLTVLHMYDIISLREWMKK